MQKYPELMNNIVCFGEVLWDMLPGGRKLGGAPLNVALRAQSVGNKVNIISAVGNDQPGREILKEVKEYSVNTNHIQITENYETSKVLVSLNEKGSASYDIKYPCAWDTIKLVKKDVELVINANAFIYGSLAARDEVTRATLFELLKFASFKVFDINLRPPHYELNSLKKLMNAADFIKMNDDEILEISKKMGHVGDDLEKCMRFMAEETNTSRICVTRGRKGAMLLHKDQLVTNSGYVVTVADTVGSGDSFLAVMISKILPYFPSPIFLITRHFQWVTPII